MTVPASIEVAEARAQLYQLLAAVFRRPLDAGQIEGLKKPEMLAALAAAGIDPGDDFRKLNVSELRHALAVDFTHIFHNPEGKIMPFEGMMLGQESELHGDATAAVERFLANVGYRVRPESGEVADHISVELDFMADLARREAEALAEMQAERADKARAIQADFLTRHLGRWADIFADRTRRRAETAFYAALAQAVADFVASDVDTLCGLDEATT